MACQSAPSIDLCATAEDIVPQLIALMPRGRAWSRHDGGPFPGSVMYSLLLGLAHVLAYANERICALRNEFWCATQSETNAQWLEQYGFPDNCDPFPNLCAKVAGETGTTCAYLRSIAAAAGWDISCGISGGQCGAYVGALGGQAKAGAMKTGRRQFSMVTITVYLQTSPAYSGGPRVPSQAGTLKAGRPLSCTPDITGLVCLIERVAHAELQITYEVV